MPRSFKSRPQSLFGRRLREIRVRVGIPQDHLGVLIGLEESSSERISRYESGVHEPPLATAEKLAGALGVPLLAYSTPFGHLFHQHPAGDSTGIRPPVPRAFGRGSRSEATQADHCYSAGVVGVNVRA